MTGTELKNALVGMGFNIQTRLMSHRDIHKHKDAKLLSVRGVRGKEMWFFDGQLKSDVVVFDVDYYTRGHTCNSMASFKVSLLDPEWQTKAAKWVAENIPVAQELEKKREEDFLKRFLIDQDGRNLEKEAKLIFPNKNISYVSDTERACGVALSVRVMGANREEILEKLNKLKDLVE